MNVSRTENVVEVESFVSSEIVSWYEDTPDVGAGAAEVAAGRNSANSAIELKRHPDTTIRANARSLQEGR